MAMKDVTSEEYKEQKGEGLKIVDLWAPWCGSCKMLNPTVEGLASEYENDLDILKVNIDEEEDIASELDVMSIPTLVFFKDGEKVESITGFQPKEKIQQLIEKHK